MLSTFLGFSRASLMRGSRGQADLGSGIAPSRHQARSCHHARCRQAASAAQGEQAGVEAEASRRDRRYGRSAGSDRPKCDQVLELPPPGSGLLSSTGNVFVETAPWAESHFLQASCFQAYAWACRRRSSSRLCCSPPLRVCELQPGQRSTQRPHSSICGTDSVQDHGHEETPSRHQRALGQLPLAAGWRAAIVYWPLRAATGICGPRKISPGATRW